MFRKVLLNSLPGLLVAGMLFAGSQGFTPSATAQTVRKHVRDAIIDNLDLTPGNHERATIKFPLKKGTNVDNQGKQTTVWFILTDVSDPELADSMGLAFSGVMANTPPAATSPASLTGDVNGIGGQWTFFGDLPNNVERSLPGAENNDYSPLRVVEIGGNTVVINAIFVKWGKRLGERLRIDRSCVSFPDNPPNTNCPYNGARPFSRHRSGHVLDIDTKSMSPSVTFKLHRELFDPHLSYYIVTDAFPAGPANMMGVPFVPKDGLTGNTAKPLIQSLPPELSDGNNLSGGGPLGGQSGLPAYFEPGVGYAPMWHIGFIKWNSPQTAEIRSIGEAITLQSSGALGIFEFNPPPPPIGDTPIPYNFNNPNPPHVVNCPAPLTVDP